MKRIIILAIFSISVFCLSAQTINVKIVDIDTSKGGHLAVALFDKKDNYLEDEKAFKHLYVIVNDNIMFQKFINVPFGTYAINVLHDENSNKKIDKNILGIPKEGYGFSNNPWLIGPPRFEKTKFNFTKSNQELMIKMNY